ncbi:MAG: hypothetical protein K6F43_09145 [Prevotella sp.]|nr:hypothetical protein [Prevotella sp.]
MINQQNHSFFLIDNPRAAFGGIFTYARYGEDVESGDMQIGERRRTYVSLMPSLKYNYVNGKNFALYSKVAVGMMYIYAKSD